MHVLPLKVWEKFHLCIILIVGKDKKFTVYQSFPEIGKLKLAHLQPSIYSIGRQIDLTSDGSHLCFFKCFYEKW